MATTVATQPKSSSKTKEAGYWGYLLLVLVSWGVVPAFAELGVLPGDVTTMYVNIVAVITVGLIITITKGGGEFKAYKFRDYAIMTTIGFFWPLVYSISYFSSIAMNGAALTTILNYSWPI